MLLDKYCFGSRVYGTHNDDSDYDYIVVDSKYYASMDTNIHVYTQKDFQRALDQHEIAALECFFLPEEFKIKQTCNFKFTLDKAKLRRSISTISSNSFVKGKKKLTVMGDYDKKLGIKSVFHSLRILEFGIQIGYNGKIVNYGAMNWLLTDLYKITEGLENQSAWEVIEDKYKKLYNAKASEFKQLCPKEVLKNKTTNAHDFISKLITKYGIVNSRDFSAEMREYLGEIEESIKIVQDSPPPMLEFKCSCRWFESNCFSGACRNCGLPKK